MKRSERSVELYKIFWEYTRLLDANRIPYWINGGTLLGAIRHGGIMPWDDDIDICIPVRYRQTLESLAGDTWQLTYTPYCYKVTRKGASYPFIDIFFMYPVGRQWVDVNPTARNMWPGSYFVTDELFPLQEYTFSNFTVKGPRDPIAYLDRYYGTDWNDIAYTEYDHETSTLHEKKEFRLEDHHRVPLRPFYVPP